MTTLLKPTLSMDFDQLDKLANTLDGQVYIEFIFHKLFDDPNAEFESDRHTTWTFPECWLARYWLNYMVHGYTLKDSTVLDLGANLNFYAAWCLLSGARQVHTVEGDSFRHQLGVEYINLRNLQDRCTSQFATINEFMATHAGQHYDVVFLQDVLYYLNNPVEVLSFIKNQIKPRWFFLEVSVCNDTTPHGHCELWYPGTQSENIQAVSDQGRPPLAMMPSRMALRNMIEFVGWKIVSYYDYQDFIGHGESPPRRQGLKDYYLLENDFSQEN